MSLPLTQLAEQLEQTLGQGNLKPETQSWGLALVDRLKAPVQIVVMGPRGAGKSSLINMLAGTQVVPETVTAPVMEIVGGPEDRLHCERADGSSMELSDQACPADAVRITRSVPIPALEECGFAEVCLDSSVAPSETILEWAIERADIVLWCTREFGEDERRIWARVPEELKDHSFMVLTHADEQMMRGTLTDRIEALSDVVSEEFLSLFPIAIPLAIAGQAAGEHSRDGMWKSSGGRALRDAVFKRVEHGRLADQDNARLFLSRFAGLRRSSAIRPPAQPAGSSGARAVRAGGSVYQAALDLLRREAERLLSLVETEEGVDPEVVLQQCVEVAKALSELFSEMEPEDESARGLKDDAAESAEMMLLFQLERTEEAAIDAVTLLMQLKREIADHEVG